MRSGKYLLFILFVSFFTNGKELKTVGPQKAQDASHDYFIGLLKLALQEGAQDVLTIEQIPHPGQARALKLLVSEGYYDLVWTGRSKERDQFMLPIEVPLFRGGLGWRGAILRKDMLEKYKQIDSVEELKELVACQGRHWPDADILERAGLQLYRGSNFDAMLEMVQLKRCDYFPLSIFEGQAELALVQQIFPDLVFTTDLIIKYPLNMVFYVRKGESKLAEQIEYGLVSLLLNETFQSYMETHPLTANGFPLTKYRNSKFIELKGEAFEYYQDFNLELSK